MTPPALPLVSASARTLRPAVLLVVLLLFGILSAVLARAADIVVDGECTLVDALHAANTDGAVGSCPAGAGADTIFLTGDVVLTAVDNESEEGPNGLPIVASEVTIEGGGFTIRRDGAAVEPFRLLLIDGTGKLVVHGATLSGGLILDDKGGSALYLRHLGTLELRSAVVTGNGGGEDDPSAVVNDNGILVVSESSITGNTGAGISSDVNSNLGDGSLSVEGSEISGNEAGLLLTGLIASITNSTISGNSEGGLGAAEAYLYVYDTTLADNGDQALVISGTDFFSGRLTGERLTISGSQTGLRVNDTLATLTNSTLSGNGVAIDLGYYGRADLRFSTVAASGEETPAITFFLGAFVELEGTILGHNPGGNCGLGGGIDDEGGNLADDDTCGELGLLTGLDPELGDNGGPTRTHALLAGSSAIDAAGACDLETDQRGLPRDEACDSGAYEVQEGELLLGLSGVCPGSVELTVVGAALEERVTFVLGFEPGDDEIPGRPCPGTELGLSGLRRLTTRTADAGGGVTMERFVGADLCGKLLQVFGHGSCATSNVVVVE